MKSWPQLFHTINVPEMVGQLMDLSQTSGEEPIQASNIQAISKKA